MFLAPSIISTLFFSSVISAFSFMNLSSTSRVYESNLLPRDLIESLKFFKMLRISTFSDCFGCICSSVLSCNLGSSSFYLKSTKGKGVGVGSSSSVGWCLTTLNLLYILSFARLSCFCFIKRHRSLQNAIFCSLKPVMKNCYIFKAAL